ncbi:hypothetical protein N7474_002398 [Penicillium riverlandense]|uniref:uncharacterized protein n=1 Tax=Penicillium riverlandense TaxID=1903569 RepID=UPI00254780DF|nr:uncharacterized protein N7474_002398 [Penicillium riverlandense]KAJ5825260.1 hypothetical protein N7474_002398 [Penicillium riverlandense]
MTELKKTTLCILGCGNLGTAILKSLLVPPPNRTNEIPFNHFIACVRSEPSEIRLRTSFPDLPTLSISRGGTLEAVQASNAIILGVDPADIETVLTQPGFREALSDKLLISIAAGWTRQQIEEKLYGSATTLENSHSRAWVVRTLPNIAAQVSQSLTAIEISEPAVPEAYIQATTAIFECVGKPIHVPPRLINAITAVGGSTPAFFAVICDAMIDAAVAVGLPRDMAHTTIAQAMLGTATMLQDGMHPGVLRDQGTSPEGCTIGGLMVMEEAGVRGHVGRALREAVTLARLMETTEHVNDTRH